jgi:hypothetical protein
MLLQDSGAQPAPLPAALPAARVMLSFMMLPPMSLQPAASSCAACWGPIFTLSQQQQQQQPLGLHTRQTTPMLYANAQAASCMWVIS